MLSGKISIESLQSPSQSSSSSSSSSSPSSSDNVTPNSQQSPSSWSWGSLVEQAQNSAKELSLKAQEFATTKAKELADKANEVRQNYDLENAANIFLTSIGAPPMAEGLNDIPTPKKGSATKSKKLKDHQLDFIYVTENVIAMAFPFDPKKPGNAEGGNDIEIVSKFLRKRHNGHFMVWNVSEEPYDYSLFSDQVLEYKFPGHPAPPLGLLFKICTAVESWLDADSKNVAVVHCLTGKGRTAALTACILTWIGEFSSPVEALQYVSDRKCIPVDYLTIPSQRRYVQYFSNMLDGVKPRSEPLLLRRIILNKIPIFGDNGDDDNLGCCPYLQLFKCGRLIGTAAPTVQSDAPTSEGSNAVGSGSNSKRMQLKWIKSTEGSISISVDVALQGDILLRFRHADPNGARISMFRAAFHTGYVPCGVLRLTKAQLDGACSDARFDDEFFIDLIFAPVEKALPGTVSQPTDSGLQVDSTTADKYEITLHKDTRFWDAVAARKAKSKKRRSRKFVATSQDQFSIADDIYIDKEEYAGTKVYFNSNDISTKKVTNTVSNTNDDLILQLARAEENPDAADSPIRNKNDDINANNTANIELQALAELEKELGLEFLNTKSSESTEKNNDKIDKVSDKIDKDNEEYQISNSNASADSYDDLDELEKYLESLNK